MLATATFGETKLPRSLPSVTGQYRQTRQADAHGRSQRPGQLPHRQSLPMGKSGCTDWVESRTGSPRLSQAKDIAEVSSTIYRLWFEPSLDEARLRHLHHLLLFAIGRARATVQRPHVMRLLQYQKSGLRRTYARRLRWSRPATQRVGSVRLHPVSTGACYSLHRE